MKGWFVSWDNQLTPKIWLLILPSSCYKFPCKLVTRIWCLIKITVTSQLADGPTRRRQLADV